MQGDLLLKFLLKKTHIFEFFSLVLTVEVVKTAAFKEGFFTDAKKMLRIYWFHCGEAARSPLTENHFWPRWFSYASSPQTTQQKSPLSQHFGPKKLLWEHSQDFLLPTTETKIGHNRLVPQSTFLINLKGVPNSFPHQPSHYYSINQVHCTL